jgi:hypothetical protein
MQGTLDFSLGTLDVAMSNELSYGAVYYILITHNFDLESTNQTIQSFNFSPTPIDSTSVHTYSGNEHMGVVAKAIDKDTIKVWCVRTGNTVKTPLLAKDKVSDEPSNDSIYEFTLKEFIPSNYVNL